MQDTSTNFRYGSLRTVLVTILVTFGPGDLSASEPRNLRLDLQGLLIRHTTAHYAIAGTIHDDKFPQYGQVLEFIHHEYTRGFEELLQRVRKERAAAVEDKFHVVILADQAEYAEFTRAYFGASAENSTGMFVPAVNLLVILDRSDQADMYGTLFHEAFHQFAHRHVPAIPVWLNEGLATYYGTARPVRGGLQIDRPLSQYFRLVRIAAGDGKLIPLRELLLSSKAEFYDQSEMSGLQVDRRSLCYAQAYTLAAYMINDKGGRKHLRAYLRNLSEVKNERDARIVTGEFFTDRLLSAMVEPWMDYVNRN